MSATNELATVEQRLAALEQRLATLEAERASIENRVHEAEAAYSAALAEGSATDGIDRVLDTLERRRKQLPAAIEALRRKRSDLRARKTLEEAETLAAAIEATGETLREPFSVLADAVTGILPELEEHPEFATVRVGDHGVPLGALADALAGHVERVVQFRVNQARSNAQIRAIQRRAANQPIDPNDLDARYAAGDFELGTRTAEGAGKYHKIR